MKLDEFGFDSPLDAFFPLLNEWVLDVWNCKGVLKHRSMPIGYGCVPELDGVYWVDIGDFIIPFWSEYQNRVIECRKFISELERLLWKVLEVNKGMINRSGVYGVPERLSNEIERIYNDMFGYLNE